MNSNNFSQNLDDEIIGIEDTSNPSAKDENAENTDAPHKGSMWKPWHKRRVFYLPAGNLEDDSQASSGGIKI
jgi:hypothetical protein